MTEFKNLALTGEMIENMPEGDRWFELIAEPTYEQLTSFNNPDKQVEKLLFSIRLSNGSLLDYFPNTRSSRFIARKIGTDMAKWVGTKWSWSVVKQMVGSSGMKDVLYIKDVYPPIVSS